MHNTKRLDHMPQQNLLSTFANNIQKLQNCFQTASFVMWEFVLDIYVVNLVINNPHRISRRYSMLALHYAWAAIFLQHIIMNAQVSFSVHIFNHVIIN